MEGDNVLSSDRRRRRRAVDGEQLLALGACGTAAVAEAGREACTKAGRAIHEFDTKALMQ